MSKPDTLIIKRPFYDGELHFYPNSHKYRWEDQWVPGVTRILGRTIPKEALIQWAADQAVDYIQAQFPFLLPEDAEHEAWIEVCAAAREAHKRTKEKAGDQGKVAHEYAENVLGGTGRKVPLPDDPKLRNAVTAFEQWRAQTDHKATEIERIVFSRKLFYAGKCDFVGVINGRQSLLDFKTGNGVYKESWFQLAGYETALREEMGVDQTGTGFFDWWIIHLNKKTGECKPYSCLANSETADRARRIWKRCVDQDRDMKFVPDLMPRFKKAA